MTLNATSVGVGRRDRFFLCMCSRNCFFFIIGIDIFIIGTDGDVSESPSDGDFFYRLLV